MGMFRNIRLWLFDSDSAQNLEAMMWNALEENNTIFSGLCFLLYFILECTKQSVAFYFVYNSLREEQNAEQRCHDRAIGAGERNSVEEKNGNKPTNSLYWGSDDVSQLQIILRWRMSDRVSKPKYFRQEIHKKAEG